MRPLWLFASLWSLRQYPNREREWSWSRKLAAIRQAQFDGIFAPPSPQIAERGDLRYLAVTSLGSMRPIERTLSAAAQLGALGIDVQLGDTDTPLARAVQLAVRIRDVARELELPFAIETHRDTFTETPESTLALCRAYRKVTKEPLPLCLDHSHFAVVRHMSPPFWPRLNHPAEFLSAAAQLHLRPFNGHHCQIPALTPKGQRTPEYLVWLEYAREILTELRKGPEDRPLLVVPEIGHAAPAYRLSCFPDTWRDVVAVRGDLASA